MSHDVDQIEKTACNYYINLICLSVWDACLKYETTIDLKFSINEYNLTILKPMYLKNKSDMSWENRL